MEYPSPNLADRCETTLCCDGAARRPSSNSASLTLAATTATSPAAQVNRGCPRRSMYADGDPSYGAETAPETSTGGAAESSNCSAICPLYITGNCAPSCSLQA